MSDREQLAALYEELGSVQAVADRLALSAETIRKRMIAFGIERKQRGGRTKFIIDRDTLDREYQSMTLQQIAKKYGVGETTVWARVKELGIKHAEYGDLGHRHRPRVFTETHLLRMSEARKGKFVGEKATNWKGGVTIERLRERGSKQYREWRKAALELRGGKCQDCGVVDGNVCPCCGTRVKLHVHHLFSFAKYEDKRFDPENSEVLCPKCHWKRHYRTTG